MTEPKPPISAIRFIGGTDLCSECDSSKKYSWRFLRLHGKDLGCIQPKCVNYYGNKTTYDHFGLPSNPNPPRIPPYKPTATGQNNMTNEEEFQRALKEKIDQGFSVTNIGHTVTEDSRYYCGFSIELQRDGWSESDITQQEQQQALSENIPKPPISAIRREDGGDLCSECDSSLKYSWSFLGLRGEELGCIQPECVKYYGNKTTYDFFGLPTIPNPPLNFSRPPTKKESSRDGEIDKLNERIKMLEDNIKQQKRR